MPGPPALGISFINKCWLFFLPRIRNHFLSFWPKDNLKGFGRHEDSIINGRGENPAVIKRDYELMKWVNANSFRTSHYPYSEENLRMADREASWSSMNVRPWALCPA